MRLFPVVNPGMTQSRRAVFSSRAFFILAVSVVASSLFTTTSFAQFMPGPAMPTYPTPAGGSYAPAPYGPSGSIYGNPYGTAPGAQPGYTSPYGANGMPTDPQALMQMLQQNQQSQNQPTDAFGNPNPNYKPPAGGGASADLGDPNDPTSQAYQVKKLAAQAQKQRSDASNLKQGLADQQDLDQQLPPPDIHQLQQINKYQAAVASSISDDPLNGEMALDMRREAQKEAALSYGARGGLAKRNFEIMESMQGFDRALDRVFNFRALLIKAPSGMLIEPPIIKESDKALVIADAGDEAAVADKVFDINKKAKIVSAPRDWRGYLVQTWSQVPPPPRVLWPKTPKEQADWSTWIAQGWDAGVGQADQIFEANVNQLVADYNGMVRYRMLLAQEMISAPYAMHEDRGVTGDENQMRVGDRAVRITGPSQFLTKAELWKPADQ